MSTTTWPASCHSRSRSSTTAKPRWTSGEVGSTPSFTRSGRPSFSLRSSSSSGSTCTACRVGANASTRASLLRRTKITSRTNDRRDPRARASLRPAARGDRARVLRRLHAVGARGEARPTPRYDQESHVHGPRAVARAARRARTGDVMDAHDLTAAYALDALDADDREAYEAHLGQCERCRAELATLGEAATALAWAVAS